MTLDYEFGLSTYGIVDEVNERANRMITDYGCLSVNTLHELIEDVVVTKPELYDNLFVHRALGMGKPSYRYVDEKRGWFEGGFRIEVVKQEMCPCCKRSRLMIKVSNPVLFG